MYAYEDEDEDVLGRVHSGLEQSSGWRSRIAWRAARGRGMQRARLRLDSDADSEPEGGGDGEMRRCAPHEARAASLEATVGGRVAGGLLGEGSGL